MNARTLLTMDSMEKVYLVDVRVGDEMEQSDLLNILLVYTSSYYNVRDNQHLVSNLTTILIKNVFSYMNYILLLFRINFVLG